MGIPFSDSFILEMLQEWFLNAPSRDFEHAEVILYDPESRTTIYQACYSEEEETFVLYKVAQWDEDSEGTIIPLVVDEVETFSILADLCRAVIRTAREEQLFPQLGVFQTDTDES